MLADADNRNITVLDAGFLQGLFVKPVHDEGVVGQFAHLTDLFLVLVKHQEVGAGRSQLLGQGGAKPPKADDTIGKSFLL